VTIWGETDGLLLSRDRFVDIGNVTQALKPTKKGVLRRPGLSAVPLWGETDGLLLRFMEIGNVSQALKPTKEGGY
jgi:hypothetical protein